MLPILALLFAGCPGGHCRPAIRPHRIAPMSIFVSAINTSSGTVTITSSDPDAAPSTSTSVSWSIIASLGGYSWNLKLQPAASTFTSCSNVPISAVKITCASIVDTALLGGSSKSCNSNFNLSAASQTLASGTDPAVGLLFQRTVNFTVGFTDSWQYQATSSSSPCTITLNYSLTAQ